MMQVLEVREFEKIIEANEKNALLCINRFLAFVWS